MIENNGQNVYLKQATVPKIIAIVFILIYKAHMDIVTLAVKCTWGPLLCTF